MTADGPRWRDAPLSPTQELLHRVEDTRPGSASVPTFLVPGAYVVRGPLDIERLRDAASALVDRHSALRTAVLASGSEGRPYQRIFDRGRPLFHHVDLRGTDRDDALASCLRASIAEGVDLAGGRPLRVDVFTLADDRHVVLVLVHHLLADAQSLVVVAEELSWLYARGIGDLGPAPAPDAAAYLEEVASRAVDDDLAYWSAKLSNLPPMRFPVDRPRHPSPRQAALKSLTFGIPRSVLAGTRSLCRRERCTPFMLLLAGFTVVAGRRMRSTDVVVPTASSGRSEPGTDRMVGPLLTFLVMRTDLSTATTFADVVRVVRTAVFEAYDHRHLPLTRLIEAVPETALVMADPEFVWMLFQVVPLSGAVDFSLAGSVTEPFDVWDLLTEQGDGYAEDLIFTMFERGDDVTGLVRFNGDLFERSTIETLAGDYVSLLDELVHHPDAPLDPPPSSWNAPAP